MRITLLLLFITQIAFSQKQLFTEIPLFENGKNNYACYRIPAIIKAPNGDLLAFAEGRVKSCNDFGDVDIVLRRSSDNGKNWTAEKIIADNGELQSGNPAPVVDLLDPEFPEGRIFLFYNNGMASEHETRNGKGLREVFYITSTDNGKTWSEKINITTSVHRPNRPDLNPKYNFKEDWRSYANTPGHALQLNKGTYKGRLFIPANHSESEPQSNFNDYRAHAFYSDDHGATWQLSESVEVPSSNESIAVELSDGRVMQNIRQQNGDQKNRLIAISKNGGTNWNNVFFDQQLITPVCQASILSAITPDKKEVLLFSNPASQTKREKMTVRMSYDDGQNWSVSRLVREGESAYSDLVQQTDGMIGLLYEHGNNGGIYFAQFNFAWLNGAKNKSDNYLNKITQTPAYADGSHFQLADPSLTASSIFFEKENKIELSLSYDDVVLRYTLDGSEPTENSTIYSQPILVNNSGEFKGKAFHPTCQPSNSVSVKYFKIDKKAPVKNIELIHPPSDKYPGIGAAGLVDLKKGGNNFRENKWMGFNGNDVETIIEFTEATSFEKISASILSDPGSWIFPPAGIEIFISKNGNNFYKIAKKEFDKPTENTPTGQLFFDINFKKETSRFLKIVVKSQLAIPDWHPGKGTPAWLFIDEVLID